jgi:hypothetical protein
MIGATGVAGGMALAGALRVIRSEDALCDRRASFAGGVLPLETPLTRGERGCFRFHELVGVMKGMPIEPACSSGSEAQPEERPELDAGRTHARSAGRSPAESPNSVMPQPMRWSMET